MERLSELHDALRGTGVSYILVPSPSPTERWSGTIRDVAQHWREDGLIDDEALDLLERDPQAFRRPPIARPERPSTAGGHEGAGAGREAGNHRAQRQEGRRHRHAAPTGGMTADQVGEALDAPEQEVFDVLASMVQDGRCSPSRLVIP